MQFLNGNRRFFEYDALNRPTRELDALSRTTEFWYDAAGNPEEVVRENARTDTLGYDGNDRLVTFTRDGKTVRYEYDGVGNRTRESGTSTDGSNVDTIFSYDAANQLLASGSTGYHYDLRGNRTAKIEDDVVTSYSYNVENQLTGVALPSGVEYAFGFDARDRRVFKEYEVNGALVANHVLYDRRQSLYELNEELAPLTMYNFLPNGDLPYGELISRKNYGYKGRGNSGDKGKPTIGTMHFYHADALGTTWKMTNHQGKEIFAYDYDAWGNLVGDEFTEPYNRFLFTGKEHDFETGLTHMDARNYDPAVGRWLQRDPLRAVSLMLPQEARGIVRLAGADLQELLLDPGTLGGYAYVGNNPGRFVDQHGLRGDKMLDHIFRGEFSTEEKTKLIKLVDKEIWITEEGSLIFEGAIVLKLRFGRPTKYGFTKKQKEIIGDILLRLIKKFPDDKTLQKAYKFFHKAFQRGGTCYIR